MSRIELCDAQVGSTWHRSRLRGRGALLGALLVAPFLPSQADACSSGNFGPDCYDPKARAAGELPASTTAIPVQFSATGVDGQEAQLVRVDGNHNDVVATHLEPNELSPYFALLRVDDPLVEGAEYAVEMVTCDATEASA